MFEVKDLFRKSELIPVIVQDVADGAVLMRISGRSQRMLQLTGTVCRRC